MRARELDARHDVRVSHHPIGEDQQALVRALARRSPEATEQVLRLYGPMLRGFLAQALEGTADLDDVLQQTLTDVWRKGPTYDPERGALATWLLVIARSRAIDHLRRRVPEPFDPTDLTEIVDAGAERELDALVERWRVAGLLAALPREEARMLALRFYEELSQAEIATRTGIPLGTVKMRMARGLERLRLAMEQERTS